MSQWVQPDTSITETCMHYAWASVLVPLLYIQNHFLIALFNIYMTIQMMAISIIGFISLKHVFTVQTDSSPALPLMENTW